MSLKIFPWRSILRSNTHTPTSSDPLRIARSFSFRAVSVAALSRTPFAKHDGSFATSQRRLSGRVAMLSLGFFLGKFVGYVYLCLQIELIHAEILDLILQYESKICHGQKSDLVKIE